MTFSYRRIQMNFNDLKRYLVQLETRWDGDEINDQEFDSLAAQAAMKWARYTRKELLGQTTDDLTDV
jgi:hypothetical protein